MEGLNRLIRRLGMLLRREQFDRDLHDEMRLHLDLRQQEQIERGLSPEDARFAAQRRFGNPALLREISGDAWGWRGLEHLGQDLRYGARELLRTPGFTAVAVLALALGIGANTAIYSVVNAVLLRPLGYKDANRLVTILNDGTDPVAPANYIDWRDQSRSFEVMGAAEYWSPNLTDSDPSQSNPPEHLYGLQVTQNLLPMLGIDPALGRIFIPGEDRKGSEHEVVLSDRLWARRSNRDPNILGKMITLNGHGYTVIGIMPPEFKFPPFWATRAELWVPLALGDSLHDRDVNTLRVFARVKRDVTLGQARADIATITGRLEREYPGTNRDVVVTPLKENVVGKIETPLLMMLGAVGFILLIACANVAHMLLARISDRQKEIAVRTVLGAGRTRVISQFLTESLLLAALGALAGLLLALWGTKVLVKLSPAYIPRVETVAIDAHVLLFLLGVTLLTAIVFGLAPAMHATAGDLNGALKEGGRGESDSIRRNRLRSFLVASEFALAFMLLIGAGLMIRSFFALQSIDPGFNPHNVLSMIVSVSGTNEAEPGRRAMFYPELMQKVRALPGVRSAGGINHLPLAGDTWGLSFTIEGRPKPRPGESPEAVYRIIMPGYFETMRLPLLRGRTITSNDDARSPGVVIINERAAHEYWPGQDPIGERITFDDDKRNPPTWLTVIGVVKNAKQEDWVSKPYPEVYLAALQNPDFMGYGGSPIAPHMAYLTLVVRADGKATGIASAVKRAVWSFDRNLPISEVLTMDQVVADATAQPRFEMLLFALFGAVALVLAAVGIYGVMNYSVSRRTREIGIRISLGASRAAVLGMVARQGMTQALAGTAVGLASAVLLSQLMRKLLYGVRPTDPITFGGVAIVLGLTALVATSVPARKATRIEPMTALRNE
ncbi:MAG: ABC transporter permease [Acidobacteriaceae bacterium]|nr:ABC transporter permease [Acidobacteriaceae bacterium]